jgi:uncharacterized membrane protein
MKPPVSPGRLLGLMVIIILLVSFVQVGALTIAFGKLGLSSNSAFLLLFTSLFGSMINLPLFSMKAEGPPQQPPPMLRGLLRPPPIPFTGRTLVAINVGGGLIPLAFSLYLMSHSAPGLLEHGVVILGVSLISFFISRPVHGIGIGMPIFIAPLAAALLAVMVDSANAAPLAYSGGTLGVLIGADLLRLKDIRTMGTPIASIGGAGTFDGVFISGIVAVLLA